MNKLDHCDACYKQAGDIILEEDQANITSTGGYMEMSLSPKSNSIYDISIE